MMFKPVMKNIYAKYDYHEYGGAPLLGVNGTSVICHGSSKARTIKNAILKSKIYHTTKINEQIIQHLSNSSVRPSDE
jgi:glycerol-3-phosphate acyltransferase PlsX